jgi:hypothetical protein
LTHKFLKHKKRQIVKYSNKTFNISGVELLGPRDEKSATTGARLTPILDIGGEILAKGFLQ